MNSGSRALLLLVATALFVVSPFFSDAFDGYQPEDFPIPVDDPPVQPAGYAFAIWSLIYCWLIIHAAFGYLRRRDHPAWDSVRPPLIASLLLGVGWLQIASLSPVLATIVIWGMLLTALLALMRAHTSPDRWLLLAPVAIYSGWLTAAAAVSLGVVLQGWGLATSVSAAAAMLALVLAITFIVQTRSKRAPEYTVTVIWALIGIVVANSGAGEPIVAGLAVGGTAIAVAVLWLVFLRNRRPARDR